MARPRRNDDKTYLHLHKDKGYLYAVSRDPVVKEDGTRAYTMVVWGTLDEHLVFHPNTRFLYSKDRWEDFVFPECWDLPELQRLKASAGPGRPAFDGDDQSRLYGSVWFLTEVARKIGLLDDLLKVFDGNRTKVNDILTLAFYPVLSKRCFNSLSIWQSIERMPTNDRLLYPKDVTLIGESITERNRTDLFARRISRIEKSDVLAVDSTSKSTYGNELAEIKWGKNKEDLPLPQTNEVAVYSLKKHYPVYVMQLPGNIPDSRTLEEIYEGLKNIGFSRFTFLTDRGYNNEENLDFLLSKENPFITAARVGTKRILDIIEGVASGDIEMEVDEETGLYCTEVALAHFIQTKKGESKEVKGLRLNLYRDDVRKAVGDRDLNLVIQRQGKELERMAKAKETVADARQYCSQFPYHRVGIDALGHVVSFSKNGEKVERSLRTLGYFASYSYKVPGKAAEIQGIYKTRDEQEKLFSQMKSLTLDDRNRAWSELSHSGRRFVEFIILSILSYIKWVWKDKGLSKAFPTVMQVIDEMKSIRCIEHRGRAKFITPFVGKQLEVCEAFGLAVPKDCEPGFDKRINSETGKRKRGRPPKSKAKD